MGETHMYQITKNGEIQKIGESALGVNKLGQSKRAESQARKLRKVTAEDYDTEIIRHFNDKRAARIYETDIITKIRLDNPNTLPLNKTNR